MTHYGEQDQPQQGGFAVGSQVWYMNNLKTVWRTGKLEDMVLLEGEDHPHIRVRETEDDGDETYFHYSFDTKAQVVQLLFVSQLKCHNSDLNDIIKMDNPTLLGITQCIGERLMGTKSEARIPVESRTEDTLTRRHRQYTRLGNVIVSMNPYYDMPYNKPEKIPAHIAQTKETKEDTPHVWDTVRRAFNEIFPTPSSIGKRSQTIILSGASGSGKPEASPSRGRGTPRRRRATWKQYWITPFNTPNIESRKAERNRKSCEKTTKE